MNNQVPDWRLKAETGMTLAQAKAVFNQPAPAAPPAGPNPKMDQIILPSMRDRWLSSQLYYYDPEYVENVCRGAMTGNLMARWLLFDLMEQTWPRLVKDLHELKTAVIDMEWNVQPHSITGKKPSAEAQKRAEICERALQDMKGDVESDERDFEDTLYDIMDSVGKGLAVSEILWREPGDPENESGLWEPRATRWVHPRYYGYPAQPGMPDQLMLNRQEIQWANPNAWTQALASGNIPGFSADSLYAAFPREQFIVSSFKMHSGHPINGAMLRILGFWWAAQNLAWEWFLNLAQIFGVPLRWATYETGTGGANTIGLIRDMMENLGSAGYGVFPAGTQIHIEKAVENAKDNPAQCFINAADTICDLLILGQTLTSTQGERGSQSLGTIHKDVRDEKIQSVAKWTAKSLNNRLLPAICKLNFGDDRECPRMLPGAKSVKNEVDTATRYKTLLGIPGITISKEQFYEDNNLIMPEAGDDVIVGQDAGASANAPGGASGKDDEEGETPTAAVGKSATARAADATERLTERIIEDLTGVEQKWLAGVKPFFRRLCASALSGKVSDAEFIATLKKAQREMPELFDKLDHQALAKAMEAAMGAACANGALMGAMRRRAS